MVNAQGDRGLDADGWRRILVLKNFGAAGHNLRSALANFAKRLLLVKQKSLLKTAEHTQAWKLTQLAGRFLYIRTLVLDLLVSVKYYEGQLGKPFSQSFSQRS